MAASNISGIYIIRNTISGKRYVGSAVNVKNRWATHRTVLRKGKHHSPRLQNGWNKYGEYAFEFAVIEYVSDTNFLIEREQHWIDAVQANGKNGYNILPRAGSRLGSKQSPEAIAKSAAGNRGKKRSEATLLAMSLAQMGRKHSEATLAKLRGKPKTPCTPETREKMRLSQLGKKHFPETIEKIASKSRGLKRSAELIARMSAAQRSVVLTPKEKARRAEVLADIMSRPDTRLKMSIAAKNRVVSQATRDAMSAAQKRRNARAREDRQKLQMSLPV